MKLTKRLTALLLCAVMALSLAACGGGESGAKPGKAEATPTPEFAYASEYKTVELGENDWYNPYCVTDKGFYGTQSVVTGQRALEEGETLEWEGQLDIREERLFLLGFDGSMTQVEGYETPAYTPTEGREGGCYLRAMTPMPGGGFLQLIEQDENWNEAPEGVEEYSEEWYNYSQYEEKQFIRTLDADGKELNMVGESVEVTATCHRAVGGSGDYLLYYTNGTNFYGLRADGESEKLFNWISCDVNSDDVNFYTVRDDGTVVGLVNEYNEKTERSTTSLVTLTKRPYSELPQKQVLTLATQGLGWNDRRAIISFNRSSKDTRIEVLDYSEYTDYEKDFDEEGNGEAGGLVKLRTEIMAGNMPDILDLNGMPARQLAPRVCWQTSIRCWTPTPSSAARTSSRMCSAAMENDGKLIPPPPTFIS